MAIRDRIAGLRARRNTARTSSPWWVNATTTAGRPVVLASALVMSAPAEYHLARGAGFGDPYAYGMPLVLSSYAGIAAVVAANRPKGARGRASAIVGAGAALALAMGAQIIGHLVSTGYMSGHSAWLVSSVSAVPPLVVGHLLHLAATREDAPAETAEDAHGAVYLDETPPSSSAPQTARPPVIPAGAAMLPTVTPCGIPATAEDAQDAWRDERGASGQPRLISAAEVARIVGVEPSTVRNWVSRGLLDVARKDARGRNWFDPSSITSLNS
ncbi:MerR family transcriptional regulator [Kitasatospora sp. A2-31]|uniref:MerR family transcriptional regulator n=1 Tax=Kitasatospora sp. A2-31 TaxID=2916414 RepID=UPI001EEDF667|nr:MerR family transcriptional regulator [Kitasatospora sp. A2-31]MCG6499442.1 MerR family transcriptional regulator [Kitasatospora sp. A2-31]